MKVSEILGFISTNRLSEAVIKSWTIAKTGDDIEEFRDLIKSRYSEALEAAQKNGGTIIYRGFGFSGLPQKINEVDFSKGIRSSRDSDNVYQMMLNAADGFKNFPSRSRSFICSTSREFAESYSGKSGAFVMLPENGAKIAVSSASDVFAVKAAQRLYTNMALLSMASEVKSIVTFFAETPIQFRELSNPKVLDDALKGIDPVKIIIALTKLSQYTLAKPLIDPGQFSQEGLSSKFASIMRTLKRDNFPEGLVEAVKKEGLTEEGKKLLAYLSKRGSKMFSALSTLAISPESLGMELMHIGDKIPHDNECWFSGKALAINVSILDEVLKEIQ